MAEVEGFSCEHVEEVGIREVSERRHFDILLQLLVRISVVFHPEGEDLSNVIDDWGISCFL